MIKVGQKIRSFDFEPLEGRGDCFMEGIVTEVANCRIVADTTRVVWDGKDRRVETEEIFETAEPGSLLFGEWDGRVTVIK